MRELFARNSRSGARRGSCASRVDALLGDDERAGGPGPRRPGPRSCARTPTPTAPGAWSRSSIVPRGEALLLHQDRRPRSGREAERWGDLHFARRWERSLRGPGAPLPDPGARRVGGRRRLSATTWALVIRGLSRHLAEAGPDECALEHQPSRPGGRRGVRRLRPGLRRLRAFAESWRDVRPPPLSSSSRRPTLVFYPDPGPEYEHDLLYVATRATSCARSSVTYCPTDHDLAIYGGLGGPDRQESTSSASGSRTLSCARPTHRPGSSSATTGMTCASTASSRTASTTPSPAGRRSSATRSPVSPSGSGVGVHLPVSRGTEAAHRPPPFVSRANPRPGPGGAGLRDEGYRSALRAPRPPLLEGTGLNAA